MKIRVGLERKIKARCLKISYFQCQNKTNMKSEEWRMKKINKFAHVVNLSSTKLIDNEIKQLERSVVLLHVFTACSLTSRRYKQCFHECEWRAALRRLWTRQSSITKFKTLENKLTFQKTFLRNHKSTFTSINTKFTSSETIYKTQPGGRGRGNDDDSGSDLLLRHLKARLTARKTKPC